MKKFIAISVVFICITLIFSCVFIYESRFEKIFMHCEKIYFTTNGKFSPNSNGDTAMVVIDETQNASNIATLIIKTNKTCYEYKISQVEARAFRHGDLLSIDFDNDKIDELLFFAEINGNGATYASALELVGNEINLKENFQDRDDYSFLFLDNKKLQIKNENLFYKKEIDLSTLIPEENFDSCGNYIGISEIRKLPITNLDYEIDSKSNVLISYSQPFSIGTKFLGSVVVTLIWSTESNNFVVSNIKYDNQ